jgi:hypothetical protein
VTAGESPSRLFSLLIANSQIGQSDTLTDSLIAICTTTLRATGLSLGGGGRRFFLVSVKTCRNLASSRVI